MIFGIVFYSLIILIIELKSKLLGIKNPIKKKKF